jgi:hypothetical protein
MLADHRFLVQGRLEVRQKGSLALHHHPSGPARFGQDANSGRRGCVVI